MKRDLSLLRTGLLSLALGLCNTVLPHPARANPFDPPPDRQTPNSTVGGGSRPGRPICGQPDRAPTATALTPQSFVGLSTQAQPILWLHLPPSHVNVLEVSVFDQQLQGIAQTEMALSQRAGFVAIPLAQAVTLTPGQPYYWTAALVCNPKRRTEDWVIGGWIRYQPLRREQQQVIQTLPPLQVVHRYLETGYWYDALTDLLRLVAATETGTLPPEIRATWLRLLQQANLQQPHLETVNLQQVSRQPVPHNTALVPHVPPFPE